MTDLDLATPEGREAARARHHSIGKVAEPNYMGDCAECGGRWPCDAAQALDLIEQQQEDNDRLDAMIERLAGQVVEAQEKEARQQRVVDNLNRILNDHEKALAVLHLARDTKEERG